MRVTSSILAALPAALAWQPWGSSSYAAGEGSNGYWGSNNESSYSTTSSNQSCDALTIDQINTMGNNSLFTRWRPRGHVLAPAGWMNDPCGAMYDPVRDLYYISYQWHPQHINWGNISWGQATSKDLIHWTDHRGWQNSSALTFGPTGNGSYNGLGIFSGTAQPVNLKGESDGTLLVFYTSVSRLPTNWALPYLPGTETQSLAYSTDGGLTYKEYEGNPVIKTTTEQPPMNWNITGFRDPFLEPSPELDAVLGVSEPHYYAVFGSGIKGVGPRIPLWTAPARNLTQWSFLGALWEPKANTSIGPVLSTGSYGFNFEVSGFFPLYDRAGQVHWYANMGTEGANVSFHSSAQWALWAEGTVSPRRNGTNISAEFTPRSGGAGDWGNAYALTSFNDTKHNRRVQWGWSREDILGAAPAAGAGLFSAPQQGFQGSLTLPRELFVHEVDHVVNTSALVASKNAVLVPAGNHSDLVTAQTLGVRPLPDVVAGLRVNAIHQRFPCSQRFNRTTLLQSRGAAQMELRATFAAPPSSNSSSGVGVILAASPDRREYTTIHYQPSNHTLLVTRAKSSLLGGATGFNTETVTGFFLPYTLSSSGNQATSTQKEEDIDMHIFLDGSLLEVYVNDRFALSTRIYPSMRCSTGFGVFVGGPSPSNGTAAVTTGGSANVQVKRFEAWLGLADVWGGRPRNSSSPLVYDSARETNGGVWWPGV